MFLGNTTILRSSLRARECCTRSCNYPPKEVEPEGAEGKGLGRTWVGKFVWTDPAASHTRRITFPNFQDLHMTPCSTLTQPAVQKVTPDGWDWVKASAKGMW